MSPNFWSSLLKEHRILDIPLLLDLCSLYESKDNPLLPKMIQNVFSNQPKLQKELEATAPVFLKKIKLLTEELNAKYAEDIYRQEWNIETYRDILIFEMDAVFSFYKVAKAYPEGARVFHLHYNFLFK